MTSQDFVFYALGTGFLILVGFLSYSAFNLSKTLKELTSIFARIDDITKDAEDLKNFIKKGIIYLKNMIIKRG